MNTRLFMRSLLSVGTLTVLTVQPSQAQSMAKGGHTAEAGATVNSTTTCSDSEQELGSILNSSYRADQSDQDHSKDRECYRNLLSLEPKFSKTRLFSSFLQALSFESFHMGQTEAIDQKNNDAALEDFEKSLQHAKDAVVSCKDWKNAPAWSVQTFSDWANYVKCTVAYFRNDITEVETLQGKCDSNNSVVKRLLNGLSQFHSPDYCRDYLGKPVIDKPKS